MSARVVRRATIVAAILLVFATPAIAQSVVGVLGITAEVAPVERRLQDSREVVVRGYVFRVGTLNGRQVVVGRSGPGKVNATIIATLLIGEFTPSAMLFSGTAGAIDPALQPGDVVIGASVAQHDVGQQAATGILRRGARNPVTGQLDPVVVPAPDALLATARRTAQALRLPVMHMPDGEDRQSQIVEGVIVTGDVFLSDADRQHALRDALGATAIEMEGGAFVQTCRQFNVPCLVVRSVTDRADGQATTNYARFVPIASENAASLVAAIIGNLADK